MGIEFENLDSRARAKINDVVRRLRADRASPSLHSPARRAILERNVVRGRSAASRARGPSSKPGAASALRPPAAGAPPPCALAPRPEELDVLCHHLGGALLLAFLVLPLARRETSLDVDADRPFARYCAQSSAVRAPRHDAMPLRPLVALPGLLREALGRGDAEARHRLTTLRVPKLGVASEVADQDHLVDAGH